MFVPLAEAGSTVNIALVQAASLVVSLGGLGLTLAWLAGLYRD